MSPSKQGPIIGKQYRNSQDYSTRPIPGKLCGRPREWPEQISVGQKALEGGGPGKNGKGYLIYLTESKSCCER